MNNLVHVKFPESGHCDFKLSLVKNCAGELYILLNLQWENMKKAGIWLRRSKILDRKDPTKTAMVHRMVLVQTWYLAKGQFSLTGAKQILILGKVSLKDTEISLGLSCPHLGQFGFYFTESTLLPDFTTNSQHFLSIEMGKLLVSAAVLNIAHWNIAGIPVDYLQFFNLSDACCFCFLLQNGLRPC